MITDLKINASIIEPVAENQIYNLINQIAFEQAKVRIMPDVHVGSGCVVGFTSTFTNKIIPNVIGVDIGCGMLTVELGKIDIDYEGLDKFIKENIPYESDINKTYREEKLVQKLRCYKYLNDIPRALKSCMSLGGGNHFIEIDKDNDDNKYLVIHSGSRNLGLQVAEYYQAKAIDYCKNIGNEEKQNKLEELKTLGKIEEIDEAIKIICEKYAKYTKIPNEFTFLENENMSNYIYDVQVCQEFAHRNRILMAEAILKYLNLSRLLPLETKSSNEKWFETIHNFIEINDKGKFIRKGAIPAYNQQRVIIPMNMKDGSIIALGKGNPDWNYSAPHGAGRLLSRGEAKNLISVEDFEKAMEGIFTTTVNKSTIDESPFAYKPVDSIIKLISPTVEIINEIKPVYNFKAGN